MKPIYSDTVCNALFNFTQMAFCDQVEKIKLTPFSSAAAQQLFTQFEQVLSWPIKEVIQLGAVEKRVAYELLSQYIIFLTMNRNLPFPPDFMDGTNDLQLGASLLRYFAHYRFPFPQSLPQ